MTIEQDMETGENTMQEKVREPLIQSGGDGVSKGTKERMWMVYFSTFVAVCGSFAFGSCIGFSSPTQSAIREDLDLSLAEVFLYWNFAIKWLSKKMNYKKMQFQVKCLVIYQNEIN
ncbi:hypothetical protein NE237_007366 [Protea cynaroides]|uniref:Uncharacterized protein n=1 Tax=Protea cynaroides TaxID=273540 RepID=A0A9Q0KP92_9MAGN|nr:hypothetical protein NE237_007366 [Protea cynaroides]